MASDGRRWFDRRRWIYDDLRQDERRHQVGRGVDLVG